MTDIWWEERMLGKYEHKVVSLRIYRYNAALTAKEEQKRARLGLNESCCGTRKKQQSALLVKID